MTEHRINYFVHFPLWAQFRFTVPSLQRLIAQRHIHGISTMDIHPVMLLDFRGTVKNMIFFWEIEKRRGANGGNGKTNYASRCYF